VPLAHTAQLERCVWCGPDCVNHVQVLVPGQGLSCNIAPKILGKVLANGQPSIGGAIPLVTCMNQVKGKNWLKSCAGSCACAPGTAPLGCPGTGSIWPAPFRQATVPLYSCVSPRCPAWCDYFLSTDKDHCDGVLDPKTKQPYVLEKPDPFGYVIAA
jgi:hypothetical protein